VAPFAYICIQIRIVAKILQKQRTICEDPENSFRIKCRKKNMSHSILSDFLNCTVYRILQATWQSKREQICLATHVVRIAVREQANDQSFVWIYCFQCCECW